MATGDRIYLADKETLEKNIAAVSKLYGNAIVETVNGEIITTADSSDLELMGLKLYGKTTQVTTNGYQLFDASKLDTKTAGGCTVTNNGDGSLTISGSGTLTGTFSLSCDYTHDESVALLQEGTLHLAVGTTNPQVVVYLVQNGSTTALDNSSTTAEITPEMLTDTTFFLRLSVYGASGGAIKMGTVKPMLYQNGDGTFEPYTGGKPSPSPDYPQELTSTGDGGSIAVVVRGKNLYGFDELTFTRRKVVYLEHPLPPDTYSLSGICISSDTDASTCIATFLNKDNSKRTTVTMARNVRDVEIINAGFEIAEIWFMASSSYDGGVGDSATWSKVQIERGKIATDYEPYTAQIFTTQTPNGLPGIPVTSGGNYTDANGQQWICDEVDFARGVYVQRMGRIDSYSGEEIPSVFLSTTGELFNGATVLYALPTPIETPLSAEEIAAFKALHTNKPNTTVYNDAGAHMEMEYIADTKLYIDNKFTLLQNAILSAGANV